MRAERFSTNDWTPVPPPLASRNTDPIPQKQSFEARHFLAFFAFFLLIISPVIWWFTGDWRVSAMAISLAAGSFFIFALLIPSDVYHLDD